jgi:CheY-like chemotaxis protein
MQRAFARAGVSRPVIVVSDGQQAIHYLAGQGAYTDRAQYPLPCLVLLDLNLPVKSGLEVLAWKAAQPALASVPVVVVTSSNQRVDFERAEALGAKHCIVKPVDPQELVGEVMALKERWLKDAK